MPAEEMEAQMESSSPANASGSPEARSASRVSPLPFLVYAFAWVAFAVVTVVVLGDVPGESTVVGQAEYPAVLLAATVFALMGPLLGLVVWGSAWYRSRGARIGARLFVASLFRSAVALLFGVAVWWAALTYVDVLRLGRL